MNNCVQVAAVRSSIGAPEIVRHDENTQELFKNWQNFTFTLTHTAECSKVSRPNIVILVSKAKFSTTASSKKVSADKCDTDGQPEIAV